MLSVVDRLNWGTKIAISPIEQLEGYQEQLPSPPPRYAWDSTDNAFLSLLPK